MTGELTDLITFPNGDRDEGDHQVIQVTSDGTLEWRLPWFRGLAALLVLRGRIGTDGIMTVTRQARLGTEGTWICNGPHRTVPSL